jgi:hypothetical protein
MSQEVGKRLLNACWKHIRCSNTRANLASHHASSPLPVRQFVRAGAPM